MLQYVYLRFSDTHVVTAMQAVQLQVVGEGIVPNMYRNISSSMLAEERDDEEPTELDPASCLPNPMPPELRIYYKIRE
jgi:hypothetical protein